MKTVAELFGREWRAVDVTRLDSPDKRRELLGENHPELSVFGMACNALLRSLRRTDGHRRLYNWQQATYAPLRAGMFTLEDLALAFRAWQTGQRYVYGFGPGCGVLMAEFFAPFLDCLDCADTLPEIQPLFPPDVAQIFEAILNAVQAAERLPVTQRVGMPTHWMMDRFMQNIGALARAGYEITMRLTIDTEESDATCTTE